MCHKTFSGKGLYGYLCYYHSKYAANQHGKSYLLVSYQGAYPCGVGTGVVCVTENIGRVTVIYRMQREDIADSQLFDSDTVKVMGRSLFSHGWASAVATALGSVPNTIYAENIAVMGIHKNREERNEPDPFIKSLTNPFSVAPYWIAGLLAILCSFLGALQIFILQIPKPVIGGMELFLFGIISAPGIQLLVDQQVNYKKVSNQLVTAAVLITGISGLSLNFNWFEIKGMSLGLVVGFTLNALVLLLKRLGILCDPLSMDEVLSSCLSALPSDATDKHIQINISNPLIDIKPISTQQLKAVLIGHADKCIINDDEKPADILHNAIAHSDAVRIERNGSTLLNIKRTANRIMLDIEQTLLNKDLITMYLNDYPDAIDTSNTGTQVITIDLSRSISLHKVESLISKMTL